ncbi:MAG: deoxynucleoside kinase [Chloroflexi bacterium]|jgi:deoxyadenosine/deoxycytidine kinase|nr:deoxynucleoside kinase [Chloroflexota bacterium]MBT3671153.1 deoxynucleoside kinase [Chloroflexota bacterium]MBT4004258.1 deoxynucleoside kinase [Chloroflexota bacterium]MBT4304388.1 deoxynucleoside kinase [Chloroflexota bacterium]MBT4534407.1 deoxynucleoside kinase [Chloroflexota bacterium]
MKRYIAIAGNIGVGKSTLVGKICNRLGWEPYYEPVAENPYLEDFYSNMESWSFHSQVFFLTHRLRSHKELLANPSSVVQDRSVYEDAEIFAKNLHQRGYITDRDYKTYLGLFELLVEMLKPPDLVVYLQASVPTLKARIANRGRNIESNISEEYLTQLSGLYDSWIDNFSLCPVLTVPADDMDFVAFPGHMELIVKKVEEKLDNRGEVIFAPEDIRQYLSR